MGAYTHPLRSTPYMREKVPVINYQESSDEFYFFYGSKTPLSPTFTLIVPTMLLFTSTIHSYQKIWGIVFI